MVSVGDKIHVAVVVEVTGRHVHGPVVGIAQSPDALAGAGESIAPVIHIQIEICITWIAPTGNEITVPVGVKVGDGHPSCVSACQRPYLLVAAKGAIAFAHGIV